MNPGVVHSSLLQPFILGAHLGSSRQGKVLAALVLCSPSKYIFYCTLVTLQSARLHENSMNVELTMNCALSSGLQFHGAS